MLQQKKSSIFSYGHYLLLIPTLLGLVLLLMSPSGKYTLSRVQDQLNKIQDQSMLSFSVNSESQVKEPVYMQWGDLKFGISKNDRSNTFSAFIDITKKDIIKNINTPFEIIDTRSDKTFSMETAGLNFSYSCQNNQEPDGIRIETKDVGQWNNFISTLKSNLTALSDACRFHLMASFEESVVGVTIFIKDEPTRKIYLENEKHRYITESYNASSAIGIPLVYHNNNNQINLRELEQILTSTHHTIVDYGESFKSNDFKIYYLRDFSTSLDRLSLLSKVKIEKEIDEPIAIVVKAANGNQYLSIFDDDERAEVTFDTWDEYFNVAQFLHLRFKHIKEQCDFNWGPLDLKPNSDLSLTFLNTYPASDFLSKYQQEVPLTQIQTILKSSPELMINDKPVPECTISFTYVDHKYLPFRCQLVYNGGVLVQGKEYLAAIAERIKPNDFIEFLEIKSDGLTKISGIRFQIK